MPAYSFSLPDFEILIPQGIKVRTTRLFKDGKRYEQALKAMRENRPARLYWKQRTKDCHLLLEAPIVEVERVKMYPGTAYMERRPTLDDLKYRMRLVIGTDPTLATWAERDRYAREEGFSDLSARGGLNAWESFLEALFRLHGLDFWKEPLYTVKWQRPEVKA
jgi:hypothetical protein